MREKIDWSKYPQKIIYGEIHYHFLGDWVKPIDLNDISAHDNYVFEKDSNILNPTKHTFLASNDAMIEGCYKFIEIYEDEKKIMADNPGRFLAKAYYKKNPSDPQIDSKGRYALVQIRINPLLNRNVGGKYMSRLKSQGKMPEKSLSTFRSLFLDKEIHLEKIELLEDKRYDSRSYRYVWDYL